jgi:DNA-directed RNA polymerase subunit beta'
VKQITAEMMEAMETTTAGGNRYVNPVYLMAHSGARGGIEQIRSWPGCGV